MADINEPENAKSQQPTPGYTVYMNTGVQGLTGGLGEGKREPGTKVFKEWKGLPRWLGEDMVGRVQKGKTRLGALGGVFTQGEEVLAWENSWGQGRSVEQRCGSFLLSYFLLCST